MISAQTDPQMQEMLIDKYMALPNQVRLKRKQPPFRLIDMLVWLRRGSFIIFTSFWLPQISFLFIWGFFPRFCKVWDAIISQASKNVEFLKDLQAVKQLGNILKTNVRACKALGHPYVHQLGKIYLDMLNVYKVQTWSISKPAISPG